MLCSVSFLTVFRQDRTLLWKGCPNFDKTSWGGSIHGKMISSPSEPFLVIRVCQKCSKTKKTWKIRFLREFWLYLQNSKVNFYDFLGQNTFNQYLKAGKKISPRTCFIFEKKSTLQNFKFLKNPFFDFHKIQNLSS